jgi:hypothetical protein
MMTCGKNSNSCQKGAWAARQQLAHGNSSRSSRSGGGGGGGVGNIISKRQKVRSSAQKLNDNRTEILYRINAKSTFDSPLTVLCATKQRLIAMNADLKITKHYTEPVQFV